MRISHARHREAAGPWLGRAWPVLALAGLLLIAGRPALSAGPQLLVFAAASTTNAMQEAGRVFGKTSGVTVVISFAASSTLARQIERGAPAAVYVSANALWMDYLQERGLLAKGTRRDLAGNRLVLIAPGAGPDQSAPLTGQSNIAGRLGRGRLAMGDPTHVPAGIYGKQALMSLGLWGSLARRVAAAATVRAALVLVERGEAPLGVVFATDAAISRRVHIVGVFPPASHRPIVYPAAIITGHDRPAARAFMRFLASPTAAKIFAAHGFSTP